MRLALAFAAEPAATECEGRDDILSVEEWTAKDEERMSSLRTALSTVSVVIQNNSDRTIRMLAATITFRDVLGRVIMRLPAPADLMYPPREITTAEIFHMETNRLVEVQNPEDVNTSMCVHAAVYEDGEAEFYQSK